MYQIELLYSCKDTNYVYWKSLNYEMIKKQVTSTKVLGCKKNITE